MQSTTALFISVSDVLSEYKYGSSGILFGHFIMSYLPH